MTIDPADFNVLTNAFRSIAAEMGDIMLRSAHSSIVREAKDCSTCLTDASGRTVAQSEMIPVHMNSLAAAFDYARQKYDITTQIGRASGRERGESAGGVGAGASQR